MQEKGIFPEVFGQNYPIEFAVPESRTLQEIISLRAIVGDIRASTSLVGENIRVLDLACGEGRLKEAFVGCDYVGIDKRREALASLKQLSGSNETRLNNVVAADMRRLPFCEAFDLVVSMYTSFGYFGDEENVEVLRGIANVLGPEGLCIIDMPNYDRIVQDFSEGKRIKEDEHLLDGSGGRYSVEYRNSLCVSGAKSLCGDGGELWLVEKRTAILADGGRCELEDLKLRVYTSEEMKQLLLLADLKYIKTTDYDLSPFDPQDSRRSWFLCRAK